MHVFGTYLWQRESIFNTFILYNLEMKFILTSHALCHVVEWTKDIHDHPVWVHNTDPCSQQLMS